MGTRLKTLSEILVYTPNRVKEKGEYYTQWIYKGKVYLNLQQDLSELDRNSAGDIDYDIQKGRTRKELNIAKGDGIYIVKIINGVKEKISDVNSKFPEYVLEKKPQIGRTITYTFTKNFKDKNVSNQS